MVQTYRKRAGIHYATASFIGGVTRGFIVRACHAAMLSRLVVRNVRYAIRPREVAACLPEALICMRAADCSSRDYRLALGSPRPLKCLLTTLPPKAPFLPHPFSRERASTQQRKGLPSLVESLVRSD